MLAEGEIVEIAAGLDESVAGDRTGPGPRHFFELRRPSAAAPDQDAMLAIDYLNREFLEVEFCAAEDCEQLGRINAAGERDVGCRARADDLGAKFLGDERNVRDMIRMAVAGKDVVCLSDVLEHRLFIGLPLLAGSCFAARDKRIDEDDRLPDLNFPAGDAEPFEFEFRVGAGFRCCLRTGAARASAKESAAREAMPARS